MAFSRSIVRLFASPLMSTRFRRVHCDSMEVLLLEDINGIGKKNDLLIVGDGFALNHLLPGHKALVATPTVRKRYAEQIRKRAEEKEREKQALQGIAIAVAGKSLTFTRKVTKTGKLYAGIGADDIVKTLKEQHGVDVAESAVELKEPIKATGTFQVPIKVGGTVQHLDVVVMAEK